MKGKKTRLFVITLLLLVGLTSGYIAKTYAKYASEIKDKTGTATVAKWKFKSENEQQTLTINLKNTPHESTLSSGTIAPGTSGSFDLALTNEETETGVDFTVKIKDKTNVPANLKFYKDEAHTTELTSENSTITGKLAAKDSEGVTVKIYWAWELGTSNEVTDTINAADTANGEDPKSMTVKVDIIGIQTAPGTTAITSHID